MKALRTAARLIRLYRPRDGDLVTQLQADANGLREVLVRAIAQNHPAHPGEITEAQYQNCRRFLAHFSTIYTVNYDLLLYWTIMQDLEPEIPADDGFRTPEDRQEEYVVWEPDVYQQCIFYLHGALHVFDAEAEVQKYTWINTGVRLIDQIRNALENDLYPIFVAEGESVKKRERIRHSDFLTRSIRSFGSIGGTLFIYGHSLADNDDHIIRLIPRTKVQDLWVGIYGNPDSADNRRIMAKARGLADQRRSRTPLSVSFYDAASAAVWG
jgi:hypothetical protein